ncbi:hypothetical protein WOLCODRAFT_124482 [Wolfiporia cocos MD-104 SS10]|uniref:C2H2-type domain-containing protein n=1 Tax=Wolfiporia cocos (strain MD-104) TaxID=742152 RepID=A0A2H3JYH4_WOLCO|nr:hypothetical protein WOLCODRAFT_124482 [Wolfiporia cocos MD-104 SS10]
MDLPSSTFSAIESHLKRYHFCNDIEDWVPSKRGECRWDGCVWQRPMYYRSFAKHIATQHLRSTAAVCQDCGEDFTRGDSRNRHMHLKHGGSVLGRD